MEDLVRKRKKSMSEPANTHSDHPKLYTPITEYLYIPPVEMNFIYGFPMEVRTGWVNAVGAAALTIVGAPYANSVIDMIPILNSFGPEVKLGFWAATSILLVDYTMKSIQGPTAAASSN